MTITDCIYWLGRVGFRIEVWQIYSKRTLYVYHEFWFERLFNKDKATAIYDSLDILGVSVAGYTNPILLPRTYALPSFLGKVHLQRS